MTNETPITAEDRLAWLQEELLTAEGGTFWVLRVQDALGFTDEEFTAPGNVTLGECFNDAIDKRIRERRLTQQRNAAESNLNASGG